VVALENLHTGQRTILPTIEERTVVKQKKTPREEKEKKVNSNAAKRTEGCRVG